MFYVITFILIAVGNLLYAGPKINGQFKTIYRCSKVETFLEKEALDKKVKKGKNKLKYSPLQDSIGKQDDFSFCYDTIKLVQLILKDGSGELMQVKPSCYLRQMQMSTEERFEMLNRVSHMDICDPNTPMPRDFKYSPSFILFQNMKVGIPFTTKVSLRNVSKVIRLVKIKVPINFEFEIDIDVGQTFKLAPGMSAKIQVTYKPCVVTDLKYELECFSDEDDFKLPIFGPRPLIDFPDEIHFPTTLVNIQASKVIIIRSIGRVKAVCSLAVDKPFFTDISKIILNTDETYHMSIYFKPLTVGSYKQNLKIVYESGESLVVSVFGEGVNGDISLSATFIDMGATFANITVRTTFHIYNRTNNIVQFCWKSLSSLSEENCCLERLMSIVNALRDHKELAKVAHYDIGDEIIHRLINERIMYNEVKHFQASDLGFQHSNFCITPLIGEIWPNSDCEMTLTFTPHKPKDYRCIPYCEVTGLEKRIPLEIIGVGKGPNIAFVDSCFSLYNIFLCSSETIQVSASNLGHIPGHLTYIHNEPLFGGTIKCEPPQQLIKPDETAFFSVTFSSKRVGRFVETVSFCIEESKQEIKLTLKGRVIGPLVRFDSAILNFGEIPIGFPVVRKVYLRNLSNILVPFSLSISGDGKEPALTCWQSWPSKGINSALPVNPMEVELIPSSGDIEPSGLIQIKVRVTSNILQKCEKLIQVKIWGIKFPEIDLLLTYSSRVPNVSCHPKFIERNHAFLNYSYLNVLEVRNKSNIPTFFYIFVEKQPSGAACSIEPNFGVLKPYSTINVNINLSTNTLEEQVVNINAELMGSPETNLLCEIRLIGTGPIVKVFPASLLWEHAEVLVPETKSIVISNICLIPAVFGIHLKKDAEVWLLSQSSGIINPDEELEIEISACMLETGVIEDALLINVHFSVEVIVELKVYSHGTPIITIPRITPVFDFGQIYRIHHAEQKVTVINKGRDHFQLVWATNKDMKNLTRLEYQKWQGQYFHIFPQKIELSSKEEKTITITAHCDECLQAEECYYCLAILNQKGKRVVQSTCTIKASFINPELEFPSKEVYFHHNVPLGSDPASVQYHEFTFKARLDISLKISTNHPFCVVDKNTRKNNTAIFLDMDGQKPVTISLGFYPDHKKIRCSNVARELLIFENTKFPYKDEIVLVGEVHYPYLRLSRRTVDFCCVPLACSANEVILLTNTSPFSVEFCFKWRLETFELNYFEEDPSEESTLSSSSDVVESIDVPFDDCPNESAKTWEVLPESTSECLVIHFNTNENSITHGIMDVPGDPSLSGLDNDPSNKRQRSQSTAGFSDLSVSIDSETAKDELFPYFKEWIVTKERNEPIISLLPSRKRDILNEVIQLFPFRGEVQPGQQVEIFIEFRPSQALEISIEAECQLLGGSSELVKITGKSSREKFSIDKKSIDFGARPFYTDWHETLTLTNECLLELNYSVVLLCKQMGLIKLSPTSGKLEALGCAEISVDLKPLYFFEVVATVVLEVGMSPPIKVNITGHSVMPQITLDLPSLQCEELPVCMMYEALEFLKSPWFSPPNEKSFIIPENARAREFINENNWQLVNPKVLPSVADIESAVERYLCQQYLQYHYKNSLNEIIDPTGPLPNFNVPGYTFDCGLVVVNTEVKKTFIISNSGLADVTFNLVPPKKAQLLVAKGLFVISPENNTIQRGEKVLVSIIFKPLLEYYGSRKKISVKFQIEVIKGPIIPLTISAIITVPQFQVPMELDFGEIKCGYYKIMKFPIRNVGEVVSEFTAFIIKEKRKKVHINKEMIGNSTPLFSINPTGGILSPGEEQPLEVTCTPDEEGDLKRMLVIKISVSNAELNMTLSAKAVEPKIELKESCIDFGTVYPFEKDCTRVLEIRNPCTFPVVISFSEVDRIAAKELNVAVVLTNIFNKTELSLPSRFYNGGFTPEFIYIFNDLVQSIMNQCRSTSDVGISPTSSRLLSARRSKGKALDHRINRRKRTLGELLIINKEQPPLRKDTDWSEEMNWRKIHETIVKCQDKLVIPTWESLFPGLTYQNESGPGSDIRFGKQYTDGTLIIVHGTPNSNYSFWSRHLALKMNLKCASMDQLILEEAAKSLSISAIKVRSAIYSEYSNHMPVQQESGGSLGDFDLLDDLEEKFYTLEKLPARKTKATRNTIVASSVMYKRPASLFVDNTYGHLKISLETIQDLLQERILHLSRHPGIIIESLNCTFVKRPILCLMMLLNIVGPLKHIHFINITAKPKPAASTGSFSETRYDTDDNEINLKTFEIDKLDGFEFNLLPYDEKESYWNLYHDNMQLTIERIEEVDGIVKKEESPKSVLKEIIGESLGEQRRFSRKSQFVKFRESFAGKSSSSLPKKDLYDEFTELYEFLERYNRFENSEDIYSMFKKELMDRQKGKGKKYEPDHKKNKSSKPVHPGKNDLKCEEPFVPHLNDAVPVWILNCCNEDFFANWKLIPDPVTNGEKESKKENASQQIFSEEYFRLVKPKLLPNLERISKTEEAIVLQYVDNFEPIPLPPFNGEALEENRRTSLWRTCSVWLMMSWDDTSVGNSPLFRRTLAPGETASWKLLFKPELVGEFVHTFPIEVVGWSNSYQNITCKGMCGVPSIELDVNKIYPKICTGADESMCYSIEEGSFSFGPLFISKVPSRPAFFKYHNNYAVNVKLHFELVFGESSAFEISPTCMEIEPGSTEKLKVWVNPRLPSVLEDILVTSIQNNPEPIITKLSCVGVRPEISWHPKTIIFDRVILNWHKIKYLRIRNMCSLPLLWQFSKLQNIQNVKVSKTSGVLKGCMEELIDFEYNAVTVENIRRDILFEVFEPSNPKVPVQTSKIYFHLESFDVSVEINFQKDQSFLDFGIMKVNTPKVETFTLKHDGKLEMSYRVILLEHSKRKKEIFTVSPLSGQIFQNQVVKIEVKAFLKEELSLTKEPIMVVEISNKSGDPEIIANVPVHASLRALYSSFRILPSNELNFGVVEVTKKKTLQLVIENTGPFEFIYNFVIEIAPNPDLAVQNSEANVQRKKIKGSSKSIISESFVLRGTKRNKSRTNQKKLKTDVEMGSSQKCGVFTISKMSGSVEPGKSVLVNFDCQPFNEMKYNEEVKLFVSDTPKSKVAKIMLTTIGSIPKVNFDELEQVFKEMYFVDDITSFKAPNDQGLPYVVYGKKQNVIDFRNCIVGRTYKAALHFQNLSLLTSVLSSIITNFGKKSKEKVFTVTPSKLHIRPYMADKFTVEFTPTHIKLFQSAVECGLENPLSLRVQKFITHLQGLGHIPSIAVTEPAIVRLSKEALSFSLTCRQTFVGFTSEENISFTNTSSVQCKVIIKMDNYVNLAYKLKPNENSISYLLSALTGSGHLELPATYLMPPDKDVNLVLEFAPPYPNTYTVNITLLLPDNPYEHYELGFTGKGFQEDIAITGLESLISLTPVHELIKKRGVASKEETSVIYHLNFNSCIVGQYYMQSFTLTNYSNVSIYRYSWPSSECVCFYPVTGHLFPGCKQEIFALFYTKAPVQISKVCLRCNIASIMRSDKTPSEWNSHKRFCFWLSQFQDRVLNFSDDEIMSLIKCSTAQEPPHFLLPSRNIQTIDVNVTFDADIPWLNCSHDKVTFEETLLCQSQEQIIMLENDSEVPTEFTWQIEVTDRSLNDNLMSPVCSMGLLDVSWMYPARVQHNKQTRRNVLVSEKPKTANQVIQKECNWNNLPRPKTADPEKSMDSKSYQSSAQCVRVDSDELDCPFTVKPAAGIIIPKGNLECVVTFSPKQPLKYTASMTLKLSKSPRTLNVTLTGQGLMSYCHFEVQESDYLSAKRRNLNGNENLVKVIPSNTKVIEIKVVGVATEYIKDFNILNPTEEDYPFVWKLVWAPATKVFPLFNCEPLSGTIQARKGVQMKLHFFPSSPGLFESYWTYSIPSLQVQQSILFVGSAREPCVNFNTAILHLSPTLKGSKTAGYASLFNQEEFEVKYKFDQNSLYSPDAKQVLEVEPISGVLSGNSEKNIRIIYRGEEAGETTFTLKCFISKMEKPMTIKVFTVCYSVEPLVSYESEKGKFVLTPMKTNYIDLGALSIKIPRTLAFFITNLGKTQFYFDWVYENGICEKQKVHLEWNEKQSIVTSQSKFKSILHVTALDKTKFEIAVVLKISRGPQYVISLQGSALVPKFKINFDKFNFGPIFVQKSNECYNSVTLRFLNIDEEDITLERITENLDFLTVDFDSCLCRPRQEQSISICFMPRDTVKYETKITFLINGVHNIDITILGEGVAMHFLLEDPSQREVNLGAVLIGTSVTEEVKIKNQAPVKASVMFFLSHQVEGKNGRATEEAPSIEILPSHSFLISGNRTSSFSVKFSPTKRGIVVKEMVSMRCQDEVIPMCILKGNSIGPEFHFSRESISFGSFTSGCFGKETVALINSGDLGARFRWDMASLGTSFTVTPKEGYIAPGAEVVFDVHYLPVESIKYVNTKAICEIENFKELSLHISGTCIKAPTVNDIIYLSTQVRRHVEGKVQINNSTNEPWIIYPKISGLYYYGQEYFKVEANSSYIYTLDYRPMTMTIGEDNYHVGSLFFLFPDGNCLLYQLLGTSLPPKSEDTITWNMPCQVDYTDTLKIPNWLQEPQSFNVTIKILTPQEDEYYKIHGNEFIDVPPLYTRDYKIDFWSLVPSCYVFKVIFTNPVTQEYLYYNLVMKVEQSASLGTIELETVVRKPVQHSIPLKNPTSNLLVFTFSSQSPDIRAINAPLKIDPKQEDFMNIEYLPTIPVDKEHTTLQCTNQKIGNFPYNVILTAKPSGPEQPLILSAAFGNFVIETISIHNYTSSVAVFTPMLQVENDDITISPSLMRVPPECSTTLNVQFEPSIPEDQAATLLVTSPTGGTLEYPIVCKCLSPTPQGPYFVSLEQPVTLNFKNVYREKKVFDLICENPLFSVEPKQLILKPQQEESFKISWAKGSDIESMDHLSTRVMLKTNDEGSQTWIYYIQGTDDSYQPI